MAKQPTTDSEVKQPTTDSEVSAAPAEVQEFPLTIEEFCTRLSATDRRVELIGGFCASEKAANRVKDTESAFQSRYADFINQPA
jgi:hypothetical protein